MASSRLDRLAKVRPDLLDLRPGHPVRAARRLAVALVVHLRPDPEARLARLRPAVRLVRLRPAVLVVLHPVARVVRLPPVVRAVPAVPAVRLSTVPAIRSVARPARASCR
jgi:hypothetical protein